MIKRTKVSADIWVVIEVTNYGARAVKIERQQGRYFVWDTDNVNPRNWENGFDKLSQAERYATDYLNGDI